MPRQLSQHPVHLGLGASTIVEPAFSGADWYQHYAARHSDDGREGRLVSMHSFDASWGSWEMHPEGSELVVCTDGALRDGGNGYASPRTLGLCGRPRSDLSRSLHFDEHFPAAAPGLELRERLGKLVECASAVE